MKPINLTKHPEGGRFQEVYRSPQIVITDGDKTRSAVTHIYFSLEPTEISRFHKLASDEVWNLYQGQGVNIYTWDATDRPPKCITLSAKTKYFCSVIPAGTWQAAEPIVDTVLVGCSVAPGFQFSDFTLLDSGSQEAKLLISIAPEMKKFTLP